MSQYKSYLASKTAVLDYLETVEVNPTRLLVFLDDSNLWISGQKLAGKNLKQSIDADKRYRIHFEKLLSVIRTHAEQRPFKVDEIVGFLYGSFPPPNDGMWKAAQASDFKIFLFEKARNTKEEKEVDPALTTDVISIASACYFKKITMNFCIITGDRDMKPSVIRTLEFRHNVELWGWSHTVSQVYSELAQTHERFTLNLLKAANLGDIGFVSAESTHAKHQIRVSSAVVLKCNDGNKRIFLSRLLFGAYYFYFTPEVNDDGALFSMILEFPDIDLNHNPTFLKELKDVLGADVTPYNTVENKQEFYYHATHSIEMLPEESETKDCTTASSSTATESEVLSHSKIASLGWKTVETIPKKKIQVIEDCPYSYYCNTGSFCKKEHTEHEKTIFKLNNDHGVRNWRLALCKNGTNHRTDKRNCAFAHGESELWCKICRKGGKGPHGHLTDCCPKNVRTNDENSI